MPSLEAKRFEHPDDVRTMDKTTVDLVEVGGRVIGRYSYEPGWRWVQCVGSVLGRERCVVEHLGYVLQGTLRVRHDDGSEAEVGPGSVYRIEPGHEGWVVGDETFITIEFKGAEAFVR